MRKRTLTIAILLLLAAVFVLQQGPRILAPLADIAGLSTHSIGEDVITPPTLYEVPAANYTFATEDLTAGAQIAGAVQVADARQVGFYVMNGGNFSLWRAGRPASLILANPLVISYNFTFVPPNSGTYYFVFDNQDNTPHSVIFSLNAEHEVVTLNPLLQYAGFEILLLGIVLSYFGLRGGRAKGKLKLKTKPAWKCNFCGAENDLEDRAFCAKCGRARG